MLLGMHNDTKSLYNKFIYNDNLLFCMLSESPEYRKILSFQTCLC